jgi:hypothetical protein
MVATVARELIDLPFACPQRRPTAGHGLCECDMHVGKGDTGARKGTGREVVHHTPCVCVTGMPGDLPAPQEGDRSVQLAARRPAVPIGSKGLSEQPECRRRIAGLEERPESVASPMSAAAGATAESGGLRAFAIFMVVADLAPISDVRG